MPAEVPQDTARRIKSIRTQYGLRQIELADRLGVTQVTVSRWEQSKSIPQPAYWRRIELAEKKGLKWLTESEEWAQVQSPADESTIRDFLADSERCWAYLEAQRLAASHQVNPTFAKESSLVDPLPHQDIAVYEHMIHQSPLRFMLADDAGAGKTIMTGLYIVEKLSRRHFDRILIVPPAGLVTNWQRELRKFFSLDFEILRSSDFKSGNAFLREEMSHAIISLDTLRQPHIFAHLKDHSLQPYDLVVFDEAHKLAARIESDGSARKTDRYRMAEAICGAKDADADWRLNWKAENVLLLTATPHMGKDIPYWYLWRLLDPESFCTKQAFDDLGMEVRRAHFIRRTKEEMVNQDGLPIYPPRRTNTFGFDLDASGDVNERLLYDEMTDYLTNLYNKAEPLDSSATQLALSVFQRRMASSTAALHCSLNNRAERIRQYIQIVKEEGLDALIWQRNEQRLRVKDLHYDITTFDDFSDDPSDHHPPQDDDEPTLSDDDALGWTAVATLEDLEEELTEVKRLIGVAKQTLDSQRESKFDRMMELLEGELVDEKVLIFTEHKDTLDYIVERLSRRGYAGQIAQIHGGMGSQPSRATGLSERDVQADFFRKPTEDGGARFLIATDAAGEGINLQFCWIMVNYDLPWNPARLEQRMGRIHRYGQKRDEVYILNMLANDTREGRVMQTLLAKIEQIRKDIGRDKVFDSIGDVLDISPSRWLRQMLAGTKTEEDIEAEVEGIEAEDVEKRLDEYDAAQGEASRVRERVEDIRKREEKHVLRRMLPGYVANFVRRAAPILNMEIQGDATAKFSLSANDLQAQACLEEVFSGYPSAWNTEMTVERPPLGSRIIFLHPGEAAFDRLLDQTQMLCETDMRRGACFVTEAVAELRMLTFLRMRVVRRADPMLPALKKETTLDEKLIAISVDYDGHCRAEDSSILLELASSPEIPDEAIPMTRRADDLASRAISYAREVHAVLSLEQTRNAVNERNAEVRTRVRTGLKRRETELAGRRINLRKKAMEMRTKNLELSLAKIRNEQRNIESHRRQRLAELDNESLLIELDDIAAVGTVLLVPPSLADEGMARDDAVEQAAMEWAERFEHLHGAQVIDVTTAEKAVAAGLNPHPGFDLISIRPDGERRAIEVKGRAKEGIVQLSANEWARAINERKGYFMYVVYNCASEAPNGHIVRDPAGCLFDPEIAAVRFDVQQIKNAAEAIS